MQFLVQHTSLDGVGTVDYASDLSIGGLFLATQNPPPSKTRVQVHFSPTRDERMVTVDAEVAHVKTGGVGLQFQALDAASLSLIASIVGTA